VIARLLAALSDGERRCLLGERGALPLDAGPAEVTAALLRRLDGDALLALARERPALLAAFFCAAQRGSWPGRAAALLALARALGRPLPGAEYALPEEALETLLVRARHIRGARVPLRGAAGHKGRVGDGVERLLLGGARRGGRASDHPAAEIKSVPVAGDRVLERVKLGVVSARSNPLDKCERVLFVFVEQRGRDHFVRGHALHQFDRAAWMVLWRDGWLVETAAGSTERPARGLYLVPRWFRVERLWPQ
jgi:hypothetical protein